MPTPYEVVYDEVTITVANGGTQSDWQPIGNPSELGLFVPTLTSTTLTVQVARDAAGTGAAGLVNQAGTAILVTPATVGGFAFSSNEMGAAIGYNYIGVLCGTAQGSQRLFRLTRKIDASDPTI